MTAESVTSIFQDKLQRSRGAIAPELLASSSPSNERAQGMPGEGLTHGPCAVKKHGEGTTGSAGSSRNSLRDGFNAYSALSLGTGLSCSHRPQDHLANLIPASGCQDHTPSRPHRRRSPARRTRARRQRVHRSPASRVVTIAIRPLHRGGMAGHNHIFPENGRGIFAKRQGWQNRPCIAL